MNALAIADRKSVQTSYSELMDEATGFSSDEDEDDQPRPPVSYTRKWEVCK